MDRINNLPNLLIVGAAKSGTTSLHNYLNQHPDIFMCTPKEPHFLINQEIGVGRISMGITDFTLYKNLFLQGTNLKYRGESSVMYLMFPDIVIPKIKKILEKDTKIIIMLRNPIERAYSGFHHVKRYNVKEDKDFQTAWEISEERYLKDKKMTPASRYRELGLYFKQVKSYLQAFRNVHIIIYDDFKNDFRNEMNRVFDFLNVSSIEINSKRRYMSGGWQWEDEYVRKIILGNKKLISLIKKVVPLKNFRKFIRKKIQKNKSVKVPKMSLHMQKITKEFYKQDVEKLSVLLERNLNHWVK